MSFIDKLEIVYQEEDFLGQRMIKWLNIDNEYSLSIQASSCHYCIPRKLLPLSEYDCFEMALIYEGNLTMDTTLFDGFSRKDELLDYQEDSIYAYVPKDLIEELCGWLTSI